MVCLDMMRLIEPCPSPRKMESLAKHFRHLTEPVFGRYGFAYADLLTRWREIAGTDVARICEPERLKRPRRPEEGGGTLVVRAAPGRALDLQHETSRLVERINGFYGYAAVRQIKIVQGPLKFASSAAAKPQLTPAEADHVEAAISGIADPELKDALRRLGTGALASRSRAQ
jgi:hypothetical protein